MNRPKFIRELFNLTLGADCDEERQILFSPTGLENM